MNVYSVFVSMYVLIVSLVLCEKESTNDDCDAKLNCEKCVQLSHCQYVHCYNETKGVCTNNVSAAGLPCDVMVIKDLKQCGEEVTTTTRPSVTTTNSSTTTSPAIPTPSTRDGTGTGKGFSGPSFIGGVVLAFGLMAIAVIVFKFYKARTEANYHTL